MFSNTEKLYVRNKTAFARWNTAKKAVTAYTAVPASISIWEFIVSPNMKLLFAYIVLIVAVVVLQVICAGKAAHYESVVSLLKARIDHPPNKSENSSNLKSGEYSINMTEGKQHEG